MLTRLCCAFTKFSENADIGFDSRTRYQSLPMTVAECLERWRALPEEERLRRRWRSIPRSVADSMAFEGEPVDLAWLEERHRRMGPLASSKPRAES